MMITVVILSLLISLLCPWYFIAVFAAMLASFKKFTPKELIRLSVAIFLSHVVAAFLLDGLAHGLVSQRIGGLLSLPFGALLYVMAALPPLVLFFSTYWVVRSSRNFVKRRA